MPISDHDLFALRNYSFAVNKTSTFFTLTTLLTSFLIVSLSVLINWKTVSHLWLPQHELDIISSTKIALPQTLTSTLFCYKPNVEKQVQKLPGIRLFKENGDQLPFKFISEAQITQTNPKLKQFIGENFGCIDIEGANLANTEEALLFEINCPSTAIYIQGMSKDSFLNGEWEEPIKDIVFHSNVSTIMGIYVTFFEGILKEKLAINYEPEKIFTIRKSSTLISRWLGFPNWNQNHSYYGIKIFEPNENSMQNEGNFNLQTVIVERQNIGSILGACLSWVSALALLLSLIISPIMDAALNLFLIETIFHLDPATKKPSLPKYLIACIKSGIFRKEDKFLRMNRQLQKLKDIAFILKVQFLFRRLTNGFPKSSEEMIVCEPIFGDTKQDFCVETFTVSVKTKPNSFVAEDDKTINTLAVLRQRVLKFFDTGSDYISVNFEGRGIGSTLSTSLTLLFAIGLLTFFFLLGIFSTSTTITDIEVMSDDFPYTIDKDQIFFVTHMGTNEYKLVLQLMDGNYKTLDTSPIGLSSQCENRLLQAFKVSLEEDNIGIYCLNQSITIKSSPDLQSRIFLFCRLQRVNYMVIYQKSSISKDKQFFPYIKITYFFQPESYQDYNEIPIKISIYKNDTDKMSYGQYLTMSQPLSTKMRTKSTGILFKLVPNQRIITVSTTTFFDMVQNIWSFTTVGISFVLAKVAKHINLKRKEEVMSSQKVKYRQNIFVLLSKISGLLEGKNKVEIQRLKYYVKTAHFDRQK